MLIGHQPTKGPFPLYAGSFDGGLYIELPELLPAKTSHHTERSIISYQVGFGKELCQEFDGIICQRVPVKIIHKKSDPAICFHPFKDVNNFLILKMVTEQGTKNDIRTSVEFHILIICMYEFHPLIFCPVPGK